MAELDRYWERDEISPGRFIHTIGLKDIAYRVNGSWQRIIPTFVAGDATFPHIIDTGPFLTRIRGNGDWQIHPTRDANVWVSIGAPFTNPANPTRVSLNPFTRTGNTLTSVNTNFDARILFGGHMLKLEFALKTALARNVGQVAFPIGAQGVTRVGTQLQVNGQTVMNLTRPVVYDAVNPLDTRAIAVDFRSVAGQQYVVYTLPALTGMASPVVDPTLTLQPDATAGMDAILISAASDTNDGNNTQFYIASFGSGPYRPIIQFDVSSIPASATVVSSILTLYTNLNSGGLPLTMNWHRLTHSWVEATVTWNRWNGVNAWSTAGGDYDAAVIASQTFAIDGNFSQNIAAVVQAWVNGSVANNGMLAKHPTEPGGTWYIAFKSSDHADATERPKLVTEYTTGGGPILSTGILHSAIFGGSVR